MQKPYDNRPMHHEKRPTGGGGPRGPVDQLPQGRPMPYFLDGDRKQLDANLLDDKARDWARSFVQNQSGKALKTTQMRRFYDELKTIERKILSGKDQNDREINFKRDKALIIMFKAKAVYAQKRGVAPAEFTQFVFDHVASIKDLKDFQSFLKVFEAVVAFHRFFAPERD